MRYYVCRAYVKWKGKMYHEGDLLPETFTHHDKARSIYESRIAEVKEEAVKTPSPITAPLSGNTGIILNLNNFSTGIKFGAEE